LPMAILGVASAVAKLIGLLVLVVLTSLRPAYLVRL
jgi:hypothetical protein